VGSNVEVGERFAEFRYIVKKVLSNGWKNGSKEWKNNSNKRSDAGTMLPNL
jgi:hypothetical protein